MKKYILLFTILALSSANVDEKEKQKTQITKRKEARSYVCPPNFMRLSYKCYYFSNRTASWQEAYWKCRDMHSNIVTIKNSNQDKLLSRTLDHEGLVPLERWIGGRYDWGTMSWKWAASGRKVQYEGFSDHIDTHDKESLFWHCIILDPTKHYRWNSRKCTEEKHYICQTKIKNVSNKGKKKLQKQYNTDKYTKLNEVPIPDIPTNDISNDIQPFAYNALMNNNEFAHRPEANEMRRKKNKKDTTSYKSINGTIIETRKRGKGRGRKNKEHRNKERDNKNKMNSIDKIQWKTYYEGTKSPLHPRVAVEEFSYS